MSDETKAEKFKRLAERRVNRAIKDIRSIGNLANPSNYEYTDDQVRRIVRALKNEVSGLQTRFQTTGSSGEGEFTL
ncbi:MAG: hypothetical protein H6739_36075 [Alphaproteobacteria bacterium]|nr:hypothetical protein [Alphaproteobacteria bacterium]